MYSFHSVPETSTILIFSFPLLLLSLFSLLWISKTSSNKRNKNKTAPEADGAWPFIGHLHLLRGPQPPHITLANMADKYGKIFTVQLGVRRALVVNNWEIAKECLTVNDKAFATRPKLMNMELLGYNNAMFVFAPYGPYWRQVRKCVTTNLLSSHRLGLLRHVRESEVKISMQQLYKFWHEMRDAGSDKALVEMKRWFRDVTLNVSLKTVVGKRIPSSSETLNWKKPLEDFFEKVEKFAASDALPFMKWFDVGGNEKSMKKIAKELDRVVEGWLQEHKEKKAENEGASEEDFMGVICCLNYVT